MVGAISFGIEPKGMGVRVGGVGAWVGGDDGSGWLGVKVGPLKKLAGRQWIGFG